MQELLFEVEAWDGGSGRGKMKYLCKIDMSYSIKNKLHKDIHKLIESYDRLIVDKRGLETVKEDIKASLEQCNKNNPQCTSVDASWWEHDNDWQLDFGGQTILIFILYHGTEVIR